jgi:two-component system cell cycle response regulator
MQRTPERILVIGDSGRELHSTLASARPGAQIIDAANFFDGLAELSDGTYTAVLAAAEPIERRPESAVRTLREMAGAGRVLLFGHPTLEPLSRKMLQFGVDDYLVTPASSAELSQALGETAPHAVGETLESPSPQAPPTLPPGPPPLASPPVLPDATPFVQVNAVLAELLLDAQLQSPQDAPAAIVAAINARLGSAFQLTYRDASALLAAAAVPPPSQSNPSHLLTQPVRAADGESGTLELHLAAAQHSPAASDFLQHVARLMSRVCSLQDRHNRLQKLAITDELTGLYNGRYFRHFLARMLDRARTMLFPVTLLLFDIDNFKKYNDRYGHGVGDEILRQTAALMKRCVRDHDLVARISGDEFAVVFWEKEGPRQPREPAVVPTSASTRLPHEAVQVLERFRRLLSSQHFSGLGPAGQGTLTISGGLAVYPFHAQSANDLIEAADRALMFKAKQSGKNSIYLVGTQPPLSPPTPEA